jgi:hypothetical protein
MKEERRNCSDTLNGEQFCFVNLSLKFKSQKYESNIYEIAETRDCLKIFAHGGPVAFYPAARSLAATE